MRRGKYSLQEIKECLNTKVLPKLLPINDLVKNQKYRHTTVPDSVWGQIHFSPWETALIDTPLMQRLRQIHQLGVAFLVYPSAIHDRFTHSMGVSYLAESLLERLQARLRYKITDEQEDIDEIISIKDAYTVKLAGLLHDIGHCMFSHYSEGALRPYMDDVYPEISAEIPNKPATHEMLGYLMLTSDYFADYWKEVITPIFKQWNVAQEDIPNLKDIAKIITGNFIAPEKRFLTEIINGPYDMDRLEYMQRDSQTAGLSVNYDKDRYFAKLILHKQKNSKNITIWHLAMKQDGIHAAEQMIMGKMLLFPYIFQHNKVLASGFLLSQIIEKLVSGKTTNTIKIKNPCELLLYTDYDLLCMSCRSNSPTLQKQIDAFKNRNFPKIAFAFRTEFCLNKSDDKVFIKNLNRFLREAEGKNRVLTNKISEFICQKAKEKGVPYDGDELEISGAITKSTLEQIANAPVISYTRKIGKVKDRWLIRNWDSGFSGIGDTIYFYVPASLFKIAFEAIGEFLTKNFGFIIDLDSVRDTIKLRK